MIEEISKKIRKFRKEKDLTLKDLSEKTDLSISFLSQVERGNSTLAITSLKKIATALDIPITYFFKTNENNKYLVKKNEHKEFKMDGCNSLLTRISGAFSNRELESMLVVIPPKKDHGHAFKHLGEEFVYVLEGKLIVFLDDKKFVLEKGDSIHYPSTKKHLWKNESEKDTKLLSIITPNIFD
ncbi:MAG: helix-turn-helix domain-containing protein [Bacillota bacterium]